MSSLNRRILGNQSYAPLAPVVNPEKQLRRLVLASMLWEDQFYIDGHSHVAVIKALVPLVDPKLVSVLAMQARSEFKLRHMPLLLCRELARHGTLSFQVLNDVIQRADEMGEFLSIYWSEGKVPLSNQVKKGLALAFGKFNEYSLAKWDKGSATVAVRDVMFLCHAKPVGVEQTELFKRVANKELKTPDTWETELSSGADKAETFSRLMAEKKLGALAFLRNLRNMVQAGVPESAIRLYGSSVNVERVLPFRYIAAARIVPQFEDMLEAMMLRSLAVAPKLPGKTVLLVDVSGSMFGTKISEKSDLDRFDAAAALAMLCAATCEHVEVYSFSGSLVRVAPRTGFALREAISDSQMHGGTRLGHAINALPTKFLGYMSRLIVFTDEQSQDVVGNPPCENSYIINVAAYEKGIEHSAYTRISGFSEAVFDYIRESEKA
jgi:hypothetical protein